MTAKEKAKELVDSFYTIDSDSEMFDGFTMPIFYAERCALIAVDEIIKSNPTVTSLVFKGSFLISDNTDYWQEVKQEIEKL